MKGIANYVRLFSDKNDMKISGTGVRSWNRFVLIFATLLWITVLIFMSNGIWRQDSIHQEIANCVHLTKQLSDITSEFDRVKQELNALKLKKSKVKKEIDIAKWQAGALYSKEHEISRRLLRNVVYETFLYLKNYVDTPSSWKNKKIFDAFKTRIHDQMRTLLADMENYGDRVDDAGKWHSRSLAAVTTHIQNTIHRLQNPHDCSSARYLTCDLNKGCGFGCQLHHVTYCLLMAAASNRTMILEGDGAEWRYSRKGWNSVFKPVSTCSATFTQNTESEDVFTKLNQSARVVRLAILDVLGLKIEQLPQSFPKELQDELLTHHSNPSVFFIAQFLWYLMRENSLTAEFLNQTAANIPFEKGPIVGLQIRRTDKVGTEAAFHSVAEYMEWAELWFRMQEARNETQAHLTRRVFVATDDPSAIKELKEKYPNYEVYFNDGGAQSAQLSNRYTDASLLAVISDIRMLSKCDYLVCTFSSQVCRIGYELMQVLRGDMAERFHSLDDIYYYGGQMAHDLIATGFYRTNSSDEIELNPGDIIGIAGNHWNGFSRGVNRRTGHTGLFPSYLARQRWRIVDFPIFRHDIHAF